MADLVVDSDVGKKRRLPVWMRGASVVDKLSSSGKKDKNCLLSLEQSKTQAAQSKVKPTTRKPDDDRPSKKKLKKGGVEIIHKPATSKRRNRIGPPNSEAESVSEGSSGDEIALTVEDLMSIAEEYVNADREKQHGQSARRDSDSETHPTSFPISSKTDLGGPIDANRFSKALSSCTTTGCSSRQSEIRSVASGSNPETHPSSLSSKADLRGPIGDSGCSQSFLRCSSHMSENFATSSITGDDATQGMLDLFLGPLLKKPPNEKWDARINETKSMALVHDYNEQVRSRAEWKEVAPLTKKKSSLKGKVSMFLD